MCLGATIHLAGPNGTRSMALSEFFQLDGMTRNVLETGELVTHLTLPEDVSEWQGDYQKLRQRESWISLRLELQRFGRKTEQQNQINLEWQQLDWSQFQCFIQNRLQNVWMDGPEPNQSTIWRNPLGRLLSLFKIHGSLLIQKKDGEGVNTTSLHGINGGRFLRKVIIPVF